jgi:hypothetical protein
VLLRHAGSGGDPADIFGTVFAVLAYGSARDGRRETRNSMFAAAMKPGLAANLPSRPMG